MQVNKVIEGTDSSENLRIQAGICSHHAEEHGHFHNKLNQHTSLAS